MSTSRGLVVIFSDSRIGKTDLPIVEQGPDATACVEVDGIQYQLYRYTLFGVKGTEHGYVGAITQPSIVQRRAAAGILFGPNAFGIERFEPMIPRQSRQG